jgi:cytochrome c5
MIMNSKYLLAALVALAVCPFAQAAQNDTTPNAQKGKAPVAGSAAPHSQEEGSRIFEQNCSRCHNAPQSFPPRISGTIVRHMRVRASLSKHDQEELLRFLNP